MDRTLNIGAKVRQFRMEKNFSQEALATELDLSQREISKIENNEVGMKVEMLSRIASILDKNITDFFPSSDKQVFQNVSDSQIAYHKIVNYNESKKIEELLVDLKHETNSKFDRLYERLTLLEKNKA